ncbi:Protein of unknown function D, partial [Prunus dulcis]
MSLPASQYSVLDAERIERVDENTFRCYVYRFKFFALRFALFFWLESKSSPMAVALSSCPASLMAHPSRLRRTTSLMEFFDIDLVSIEIPFAFRAIPAQAIESSGTQVLEQILRIMLPRFMSQLVRDYRAWASGDRSRQPLGTAWFVQEGKD